MAEGPRIYRDGSVSGTGCIGDGAALLNWIDIACFFAFVYTFTLMCTG